MKSLTAVRQLKLLEKFTLNNSLRLAAEWDEKWKVLIATILSAQTRDEKTIEVCEKLFEKYNSPEKLSNVRIKQIEKIIKSVNYYKTKSKHILETARIICKKGIPESLEGLLELPGVGRKVANVYLAEACQKSAIGVDTHLTRISQKLGWTENKNPHKIEKDLEKLFPKKYWRSINYIVVRFGRSYWSKGNRKEEDEILGKIIQ